MIMQIIAILMVLLVFIILKLKRPNYGYMIHTLKNSKNNELCDVELTYFNSKIRGLAKINGSEIGSLTFYKWELPSGLVIANNLEIKEAYRGKGFASYLIQQCSKKIVENGGFGIFSTNYDIDGVGRLHECYWYKMRPSSSQIYDIKKIDLNEIVFTNYPKNDWLNVNKEQIIQFLDSQVLLGLVILRYQSIIIGVENVTDKDGHDVCHIKWFWGDISHLYSSITKLMHVKYMAIPSLNIPSVVWDKSITYVYPKPIENKLPFFSEKDICGWYLDR